MKKTLRDSIGDEICQSTVNDINGTHPAVALLCGKCGTGARSFGLCFFFIKNLPIED